MTIVSLKPIEPKYRIIGAISVQLANNNQNEIQAYRHAQEDVWSVLEHNVVAQIGLRTADRVWMS